MQRTPAQTGFVKAWRTPTLRPSAPCKPWLLRIVANEAHNRRRSAGRVHALALRATAAEPSGDAVPSPEGVALGRVEREALLAAVQRLDERDRDMLTCRYLLELSEEETATVLDLRRGTVVADGTGARPSPFRGGVVNLERALAGRP